MPDPLSPGHLQAEYPWFPEHSLHIFLSRVAAQNVYQRLFNTESHQTVEKNI